MLIIILKIIIRITNPVTQRRSFDVDVFITLFECYERRQMDVETSLCDTGMYEKVSDWKSSFFIV